MRVRIIRPLPAELEGFELGHFVFQGCYEINAPLCDLLLVRGYGIPEDRAQPKRTKNAKRRARKRRE